MPYSAPAGGVSSFANDPGYTLVSQNEWNSKSALNWHDISDPGDATILTDATAPYSPSNVLEQLYPAAMTDDQSSVSIQWISVSQRKLYCAFWIKFSSNFYGHPVGTNKLIHHVVGGSNHCYSMVSAGSSDPLVPILAMQGTVSNGVKSTGGAAIDQTLPHMPGSVGLTISRNAWHHYEYIIIGNTNATADGSLDMWIDGLKTHEIRNVQFSAGAATHAEVKMDPTWGGNGFGTVGSFTGGQDMSIRYDVVRISQSA